MNMDAPLNIPPKRLKGADILGGAKLNKAGVLPFHRTPDGGIEFFFVLPEEKLPKLGPQEFQIAKGTAKVRKEKGWRDMKASESIEPDGTARETLAETALREGEEEIGLQPEMVSALYDAGKFRFSSRRELGPNRENPGEKWMRIFLAEIEGPEALQASRPTKEHPQDRQWMAPDDPRIRDDHRAIAQQLAEMLSISREQRRS